MAPVGMLMSTAHDLCIAGLGKQVDRLFLLAVLLREGPQ